VLLVSSSPNGNALALLAGSGALLNGWVLLRRLKSRGGSSQ
jgi:hypothetical protein